jgi:uncharacterized protein (TIGR02145 family)
MKKVKKAILLLMFFPVTFGVTHVDAQVRIGGSTAPNTSSVLDLNPSDAGTASGGLLLPRVNLIDVNSSAPFPAHVNGLMVYNLTNNNGLSEGIYFSNGKEWFLLEIGVSLPVIVRQPGFIWLGEDGSLTDTLFIGLSNVDKTKITRQWYFRDPDTQVSTPVNGATSDTLIIDSSIKTACGITTKGKIYQLYCRVNRGSKSIESETGRVVYGIGALLNNGKWIRIANANLGADQNKSLENQMVYHPVASTPTNNENYDPTVYGDLYQWGRKKDGHQVRNVTVADGTYDGYLGSRGGVGGSDLNSADGQIKESSNIYGKFILCDAGSKDWRHYSETLEKSATSPAMDWTWDNPNNDPCKAELGSGWRLPTVDEWSQIHANNTWIWRDGGTDGVSGYEIKPNATKFSSFFLPAAGYRLYDSGQLDCPGVYGLYWSSSAGGDFSYCLYFLGSGVIPADYNSRAYGFSVRCIAD